MRLVPKPRQEGREGEGGAGRKREGRGGGEGKAGREAAVPITVPHHWLQRLVKAKRYLSTEASGAGFPPPATHLCPRPSVTPARRPCSEGGVRERERERDRGRERERETDRETERSGLRHRIADFNRFLLNSK